MLKKFLLVLVGVLAVAVVVPMTSSATHTPTLLADDASKGGIIGG